MAAIEGLAGVEMEKDRVSLDPHIPSGWDWLKVHNVRYRNRSLSFFVTREEDGLHAYTSFPFQGKIRLHSFEEDLTDSLEMITTGVSSSVFRKEGELLICLGNSFEMPSLGPFLAHRALSSRKRYGVSSLSSQYTQWQDLGTMKGSALQRIVVRIEGRGYSLYRFIAEH